MNSSLKSVQGRRRHSRVMEVALCPEKWQQVMISDTVPVHDKNTSGRRGFLRYVFLFRFIREDPSNEATKSLVNITDVSVHCLQLEQSSVTCSGIYFRSLLCAEELKKELNKSKTKSRISTSNQV